MKIGKTLGGALAALLLLLVAGALAADVLARSAVEASLGRTFGTEAGVESLDLEILRGRVSLAELTVANPEGFHASHLLSLRSGSLSAGLSTVLRDTVEVEELRLEGLQIALEQRGGSSNVGPVLERAAAARSEDAGRGGTAFRIHELVIRDVTARLRLDGGAAGTSEATVRIPEVRMEDVGSGPGGAVTVSRLADLTLRAVLGAVARRSGGPGGALGALLQEQVGDLPGGVELRLPGSGDDEGLRERAEEELRQLIPGRDGGG